MEDSLKIILQKLDEIINRLKKLEIAPNSQISQTPTTTTQTTTTSSQRDPLFLKAVELMEKYDEISSATLEKALKIDKTRAEKLLDQLEEAGYGTCYWKEV